MLVHDKTAQEIIIKFQSFKLFKGLRLKKAIYKTGPNVLTHKPNYTHIRENKKSNLLLGLNFNGL